MNFPFYIAKRYLFTKNKNNAINIISKIAAAGVVFGSMVLLIVLAGFAGLKTFTLAFNTIVESDFKITPKTGKRIELSEAQRTQLKNNTSIINYSAVVEEKVFLQFKSKNELATVKGVDENYSKIIAVDSILVSGQWIAPKTNQTVAGFLLADKLQMGVFDYTASLEMFVPKPGSGQINEKTFRKITAQNVGLFEVNEELNQQLIYTSVEAVQDLLQYDKNTFSAIELKTIPNLNEAVFREQIQTLFNNQVVVKNKFQQNDALHKMLNTENVAVYLIFTLILIIALFNVIGAIIMMIIAKKSDLKTLHNLGLPLSKIKQIFFLQGALLTTLCGVLGVFLGVLLIAGQLYFEFIKIPGTPFAYPVALNGKDIFIVLVTIFVLGLLASKIASYRISKKILA